MKKLIVKIAACVLLVSVLIGHQSFAQEVGANSSKFYFSFNPGYSFGAGGTLISNSNDLSTSDGYSYTVDTEQGYSLGKGLSVDLAAGFMFSNNLGIEMGISYLLGQVGGKNVETDIYRYDPAFGDSYTTKWESEAYGSMLRITPGLRISTKISSIEPYAVFGAVIGIGKFNQDIYDEDYTGTDIEVEEYKYEYGGGVALGYQAKVGVDMHLADPLSLFAEFRLINMSYSPTKGELVEYTVEGEDQLIDMDTNEKEFVYVDPYNYDSEDDVNENEPRERSKFAVPMGSMGVNIGIRLSF